MADVESGSEGGGAAEIGYGSESVIGSGKVIISSQSTGSGGAGVGESFSATPGQRVRVS